MAVIGNATLNIIPKVQGGLANAIDSELQGFGDAGDKAGTSFKDRFTSSASFAVWSQLASKAFDVLSDSIGAAAARVDTLNNYPKVMETLGVSTDDANKSIQTMSDDLQNVPTRLDDMASTVQGLYAATKKYGTELGTATDAGVALNDMLLAGGQSTGIVNAAMEQFRQMVSKGKPELQDWKSLIQAAPGQMEQLAEAMLGAGASADDLYAALGGGKAGDYTGKFEWGSLGMDEFIEKFAGMKDKFAGAAEEAQGGIQTSLANMQNAVTRGLAGIIDGIGQENIAAVINDVKGWINDLFAVVQGTVEGLAPLAVSVVSVTSDIINAVTGLPEAVDTVLKHGFNFDPDAFKLGELKDAIADAVGDVDFDASAASALGDALEAAMQKAEGATKAAKSAHEDYISSVVDATARVQESDAKYEGEYARLENAAKIIEDYGNKAGTTAGQQHELEHAIDTVNQLCGTQYEVMKDGYTVYDNSTQKVLENTQGIMDNIEARKLAAKAESIQETLSAEQDVYDKAAYELAKQKEAYEGVSEAMGLLIEKYGSMEAARAAAGRGANRGSDTMGGGSLEEQQAYEVVKAYDDMTAALGNANEQMDTARAMTENLSTQYDALSARASDGSTSVYDLAASSGAAAVAFADNGLSLADFAGAIEDCATKGDALNQALANPETMATIAAAYDGTAASLQGVFEQMGIGWDESKAKMLDTANNLPLVVEAFGTLDAVRGVLDGVGISADDLSTRLSNAGVTSQQLAGMGIDAFGQMAQACGGNIDYMVAMIATYNAATVDPKTGEVQINQEQLDQTLAKIGQFNDAGDLVDKNGKVLVTKEQLDKANEDMQKYKDTILDDKQGHINVDEGGLPQALSDANSFISLPDSTHKEFVTTDIHNVVTNYETNHSSNARGGHAVPRHAGGYIATGATMTGFGLVGENGVEAVWNNDDGSSEVYPLNNPRYLGYAKPLADSIAGHMLDAMRKAGGVGGKGVNLNVQYGAPTSAREMAWELANELSLVLSARGR